MTVSGVYPCYENQFKIGASAQNASTIADMETFSVSIDNGVEEWTPFESEGWIRRLMTAKGITLTVQGKRNVGDTGNDFVAAKLMANGRNSEVYFEWTFPDGAKLVFAEAVLNITNIGAGDSTAVGPLEFEIMSNGKPTYTAAS
jgi:hypothetical protein